MSFNDIGELLFAFPVIFEYFRTHALWYNVYYPKMREVTLLKKFIKNNIPAIVSVVFTIIILIAAFVWFNLNIRSMVTETNEEFLMENAAAGAEIFYTKLTDQQIMLESQTRYFYDIDMTDYNAMKNAIISTKGIGAFKTIGVANSSGTTLNYNGKSSGNILLTDYFKAALDGESAISGTTAIDEDGDEVLVMSVPIIQSGESAGAVFGTFTKSMLSDLIGAGSFSGQGFEILMDASGNIIAVSANADAYWNEVDDFFAADITIEAQEEAQMLQSIAGQTSALLYFDIQDTAMTAVLTPVGIHDWFYMTLIPNSVITRQTSLVTMYFLIVVSAVTVAFMITIISILYLAQRNNIIQKSNERYRMVTSQTQAIVFEADLVKNLLDVSGNVEIMFSDEKEIQAKDIKMLLKRIHPDDEGLKKNLMDAITGTDNNFSSEGRFLCIDEEYYWFHVMATIVRGDDGKAVRMIGNMLNVEERHKEANLLKQKAEIDALTGIFNKGAFEKYVADTIRDATDEDILAFYIIDLDYFKQVNDNLGHAVGDKVLSDVAKKLCTVFSDKDTVGRIGGDEFAVLLKLNPDGRKLGMRIIESRAKAIVEALKDTYSDGKHEVSVSASVGISIFPEYGNSYDDLYKNADAALYASKKAGKNQYFIFG